MPNWCHNVLSVEGNYQQVELALSKIINDDDEVDFNLVVPMPPEMRACYRFNKEARHIEFLESNPNRLGLKLLRDLVPIDADHQNMEELRTSDLVDVNKSIEDNLRHMSSVIFSDLSWNALSPQGSPVVMNFQDGRVFQTLLSYIQSDHVNWCVSTFGYGNWYDWSIGHWGTKWNSFETQMIFDNVDDKQVYSVIIVGFDTAWCAPSSWFDALSSSLYNDNIVVKLELEYGEPGMVFGGRYTHLPDGEVSRYEFEGDELSEFLYGDSTYMRDIEWHEAEDHFENTPELNDEFNDHHFSEEELEDEHWFDDDGYAKEDSFPD